MKPKLRDLLTDLFGREPDMEVTSAAMGTDLASIRPDVLVCETEDPLDDEFPTEVLRTVPSARVLIIADPAKRAVLYELRPAQKELTDLSVNKLMDAIRFGLGRS